MKSKAANELLGLQLQQTSALVKKKENDSKEMETAAVAARVRIIILIPVELYKIFCYIFTFLKPF